MAHLRQNDFMETHQDSTPMGRYAHGLTKAEVQHLQDILRRECGIDLTLEAAWARAIELLALFRLLLEPAREDASSNIGAIDAISTLRH